MIHASAARHLERAPLVIAAHGSADPAFHVVVGDIAERVRAARPGLDVRIGYLDHGPPHLSEVAAGVVVPLLLTRGHHVSVDLPAKAAGVAVASAVGPDPALAGLLATRLRAAGWLGEHPVVLAGAGSSDLDAIDDVHLTAGWLADLLGVAVIAAFAGSGSPSLDDVSAGAIATYLLAPGHFADTIKRRAPIVAEPLGADPVLVQLTLARYDAAVAGTPVG